MHSQRLTHKLLFFWLGSIILSVLIVGILFSLLTTRLHEEAAKSQIQHDFGVLWNELNKRRERLQHAANLLAEESKLVATISLIHNYQDIHHYQPLVFDDSKKQLANLLMMQTNIADLDCATVTDGYQRLASFSCLLGDGERTAGYIQWDKGLPSFQALNQQHVILPEEFVKWANQREALSARPRFSACVKHQLLLLEISVPVVRTSHGLDGSQHKQTVGFIRLMDRLDQEFTDQINRQTKAQFHYYPFDKLPKHYQQIPRLGSGRLPYLVQVITHTRQDWWLSSHGLFVGAVLLDEQSKLPFVATFQVEKDQLSFGLSAMRQAVFVMVLLAIFFLLPAGWWFFRHTLLLPLARLLHGVETLRQGRYIELEGLSQQQDELGILAVSFNTMSRTLALREERLRKLSLAVEQSPTSILITDAKAQIEYVNLTFTALTGYSAQEIQGKNPSILKSGYTPKSQYRDMWRNLLSGQQWRGELYNRKKDGTLFWETVLIAPIKNEQGEVTHYLGIKEDLTLRKQYEQQLLHQAHYDNLTGLPNRILALDRLEQALLAANRHHHPLAIAVMDVDHLKHINDSLGHEIGDKVLAQVAARLQSVAKSADTIARLGGDDFLFILPLEKLLNQRHALEDLAAEVENSLSLARNVAQQPIIINQQELFVSLSIGLTLFPHDGESGQILLRNAETAMYRAKEEGRNRYCFFTPQMNDQTLARMKIENELRKALARGELSVHYQPQIDLRYNRVSGAEALLRWNSAQLGFVPPDQFIPIAESCGLITDIGLWVLEQACHAAALWHGLGYDLRIAVNVSPAQFKHPAFVEQVVRTLNMAGVSGLCLELEVTESLFIDAHAELKNTLHAIKNLGISLALDDFGTGYSSLSYLKNFPFDYLKIDKSFIQELTTNPEDCALTTAIIRMAHSLQLAVIAEGVETAEHLAFLKQHHCDYGQGFYYSKALAQEDFSRYLVQQALPDNG